MNDASKERDADFILQAIFKQDNRITRHRIRVSGSTQKVDVS